MMDFLAAVGLVFVIEGAMFALFPDGMKKMTMAILQIPSSQLRGIGLTSAIMGFLIIAAIRGF